MGNERTKEYPDILDFVNKSLESRDQYDNEEWLREQLSEVDQKRREHLEPLLTEAQTLITKGDDGLVSLSPSTESKKNIMRTGNRLLMDGQLNRNRFTNNRKGDFFDVSNGSTEDGEKFGN
jgi:hypothetical protein